MQVYRFTIIYNLISCSIKVSADDRWLQILDRETPYYDYLWSFKNPFNFPSCSPFSVSGWVYGLRVWKIFVLFSFLKHTHTESQKLKVSSPLKSYLPWVRLLPLHLTKNRLKTLSSQSKLNKTRYEFFAESQPKVYRM